MKVGELIDKFAAINRAIKDLEVQKQDECGETAMKLDRAIDLLDEYAEMIRNIEVEG